MSEHSNTPAQTSLDRVAAEQTSADRFFVIVSTIAVIAAIVGGFWLLGSPNKQRLISLDQERVQDLRTVARRIQDETNGNLNANPKDDPLPEKLSEDIRNRGYAQDPVTNEVYEYNRLSDDTYELCATFATSTESDEKEQRASGYQYNDDEKWEHPEGRHCYEIERNTIAPKA